MAKKFGTTWWGEQWLNSLSHIDYSNRLPRGVRYARNGSVQSIEIDNGTIEAYVAGSQRIPYSVTIGVQQFDKKKVKAFVDRLVEHPLLLASLMQRRLDPGVLKIAEDSGLKVFPSSWKDLQMHCSCPDWAVPCKHIAAVIYKVSEEIDNNPFLVFSLHGMDLLGELKKRGLLSDKAAGNLDPMPVEQLLHFTKEKRAEAEWKTPNTDFSTLPDTGGDLLELLPDNPSFSLDGDFKKIYTKCMGTLSRAMTRILSDSFAADEGLEVFEPGCEVAFSLGAECDTETVLLDVAGKTTRLPFAEFATRLGMLTPVAYVTAQPWVPAMHKLWLLAANLVRRKLIVPRIVKLKKGYRIIWEPAMLHPDVRGAVEKTVACIPDVVEAKRKGVLRDSGYWLLCAMLGALVASAMKLRGIGDLLFDFFFLNRVELFSGLGQRGVPGGIKVWTDRLFMLAGTGELTLCVEECDTGFEVTLLVAAGEAKGELARRMPLAWFMADPSVADRRLEVMTHLSALTDYMPEMREYILSGGVRPMRFTTQTFVPFLFKTLPLMRLLGVDVALPKSLHELVSPKLAVKIGTKTDAGKSFIRLDELLEFDWRISLGDEFVSVEEFDTMMKHAGELIKFKGRYVYTTPEELEKLRKALAKGYGLTPVEMLAAALSESYRDAPVEVTAACSRLLKEMRRQPSLPVPEGLQASLRPYQKRGYEWMMHNLKLGFGAVIADDMGLGKTLQVIAVLLALKESGRLESGKALIVVPAGLLGNWQKECLRFAPALATTVYHGPTRETDSFDADVMLTSYAVMRTDRDKLKKLKWEVLVVDEAQNIKNTAAAQTKAVNSLPARWRIAMSGTPVENRLSEFWSIMNFANKGMLGTLKEFNTTYGRPIQTEGDRAAAERLKATTAPFMLRRLKSDKSIIADLPDKVERDEYATLTPQQTALYQKALDEAMRQIEGIQGDDHASLFRREGLVLQMILALKQICNHPAQFLKTRQADAELSGKAMLLLDLVRGIVDSGEKVLIFTQFKEMGRLIEKLLAKADIPSMFYHGGTSLKKREEMVERFQNVRSDQVFILSLKAAGTGLNLTAATNVIHYDLWWNPAVEAQATDRAYRIGQHRNVQVYRFITRDTFEERINDMIQQKKELADLTVGTDEKWLARMSDTELRNLFTLTTSNK